MLPQAPRNIFHLPLMTVGQSCLLELSALFVHKLQLSCMVPCIWGVKSIKIAYLVYYKIWSITKFGQYVYYKISESLIDK